MGDLHTEKTGCIFLLDSDVERRQIVRTAAHGLGLELVILKDTTQLAECQRAAGPGCLIVSDRELSQVEQAIGRLITDFQSYVSGGRLNLVGRGMATIVLCQEPEVQKIVRYMRAGAQTVLPMPLEMESLSHWMIEAVESDRQRRQDEEQLEQIRRVYDGLAERKRRVLQHMIDGRASKWSAHDLDVSRRTIELDRAEILNAFEVSNAIELARLMTETKCLPLNYSLSGASRTTVLCR